jgi:transmembrane sensor
MTEQPPRFRSADDPELWEALARYVAGESSPEEAKSMQGWLAADPRRQEMAAALARSLGRVSFVAPADLDVETALTEVKLRASAPAVVFPARTPPERVSRGRSTTLLRLAAAVLVFIGGALFWWLLQGTGGGSQQIYTTAIGQTDSLNLPDGTRVVLAPSSELLVPEDYAERERTVRLQGEALFEVQHDDARPFSVSAGPATVRDLGTRFTVRSYRTEPVRVVVTSGSVLLRATAAADSGVVLRAGESGELASGTQTVRSRRASEADLAWTRGRLVFENAPIEQVMIDLRRWYGIELRLSEPALANQHITATFERESAQQVLDIVALALGAQVERRGDTAFIGRRSPR